MLRIMTISMQVAREHHAEGERLLALARRAVDAVEQGIQAGTQPTDVAMAAVGATNLAALAQAEFAASMSATGIVLATTAPAER